MFHHLQVITRYVMYKTSPSAEQSGSYNTRLFPSRYRILRLLCRRCTVAEMPLQTFFIKPGPPLAILEQIIKALPISTQQPPKTQTYVKLDPSRIQPDIGVPSKRPTETIEKPIPIRVPIMPRFGERCTKMVGGSETSAPEKNP